MNGVGAPGILPVPALRSWYVLQVGETEHSGLVEVTKFQNTRPSGD